MLNIETDTILVKHDFKVLDEYTLNRLQIDSSPNEVTAFRVTAEARQHSRDQLIDWRLKGADLEVTSPRTH